MGGKDNKINLGEIKGIKYKKDKINKGKDKKGKKGKRDSKKQIWAISYRPYLMYKGRYIASSSQAYNLSPHRLSPIT